MKKYYIKNGYEEIGPFSILELESKKINRTTFIRLEENENWVQADSLPELDSLFKNFSRKKIKVYSLILISILVLIVILGSLKSIRSNNNSFNSIIEKEVIVPPPLISFQLTEHKKVFLQELFKDCNLKGNKKKLVYACNYTNSTVRSVAVKLAGESPGTYNLGQVCNIFDYCYNNWKYVNDPKSRELYEFASNTILNGLNGDCDDFAVLICSMVLSIGGEARINFAYGSEGGHAFTEVNIGKTNRDVIEKYIKYRYKSIYANDGVWYRVDGDNSVWLNLDWFSKHPGGKYFNYRNGTTFYIIQQYCSDFTK